MFIRLTFIVLLLTAFSCNQKKGEETQEFSQLSDEHEYT
jgi:hypothetical protein